MNNLTNQIAQRFPQTDFDDPAVKLCAVSYLFTVAMFALIALICAVRNTTFLNSGTIISLVQCVNCLIAMALSARTGNLTVKTVAKYTAVLTVTVGIITALAYVILQNNIAKNCIMGMVILLIWHLATLKINTFAESLQE